MKTLEYNVSSSDRDFTFSDVKPYMQYDIGVGATVLIDGMEREIPITRPRSVSSPEARMYTLYVYIPNVSIVCYVYICECIV